MKKSYVITLVAIFILCVSVRVNAQNDTTEQKNLLDFSIEELMEIEVVTVSKFKQSITDAPGAVTVISKAEIEKMGYRTLSDILLTLPGFSLIQNDDEQIIAVRGIYGTTNQKFLVLRDGHIINDFLFDRVDLGYSFSLDNVKKIEIIRGPSASLYGTAAVTSVINIISEDTDKSKIKVSFGNNGQKQLDVVYSKKGEDDNYFSSYFHFADIEGQYEEISKNDDYITDPTVAAKGEMYIGNYPKNIDAGFMFQKGMIKSSLAVRHYEYGVHWGLFGQNINRDTLFVKPGMVSNNIHYDLSINKSFADNKFHFSAQHFYDYNDVDVTKLILTGNEFGEDGRLLSFGWEGYKLGLNYSLGYNFDNGNIIVGFMTENRVLDDSYFISNWTEPSLHEFSSTPLLPNGNEIRGAGYLQLQHNFVDNRIIVNAGARYDYNNDFDPTFNPRIALITKPTKKLTVKAVYTKAFQAPAYFYRESNPNLGYGSTDQLNAEIMTSMQGIVRYNFNLLSFIEFTYFYNNLDNLVRKNGDVYENFGNAVIQGLEVDSRIKFDDFNVFANYTLLIPVEKESDSVFVAQNIKDGVLKHLPENVVNVGIGYAPMKKLSVRIWTKWTSEFISQARTSTLDNNEVTIDSKMIFNLSILSKNILPSVDLSLTIYNIADKEYRLGDPVAPSPILQQGRWFVGTVSYNF